MRFQARDCHSFEWCHPRYWIVFSPPFFSIVSGHHRKACPWLTYGHSSSVCLLFQVKCREQLFTRVAQVSTIPIVYIRWFDFTFVAAAAKINVDLEWKQGDLIDLVDKHASRGKVLVSPWHSSLLLLDVITCLQWGHLEAWKHIKKRSITACPGW